jgi:hypothetical protein
MDAAAARRMIGYGIGFGCAGAGAKVAGAPILWWRGNKLSIGWPRDVRWNRLRRIAAIRIAWPMSPPSGAGSGGASLAKVCFIWCGTTCVAIPAWVAVWVK